MRMSHSLFSASSIIFLLSLGCRDASDEWSHAPDAQTTGRAGPPWFEEVAKERGIDFVFRSGHTGHYYMPEIMAGGAALFDMDMDGDLDAYLIQGGRLDTGGPPGQGNQLYRNSGDGRFENVTSGSGADDRGYGMGAATGDYDNDGDTDLYVTNVGADVLLRNDGRGLFTDVTAESRLGNRSWGASAAFLDHDRDGDLDLFVTNYVGWSRAIERTCVNPLGDPDYCHPLEYDAPTTDLLYRNQGDGTFADVTVKSGLASARGNGLGVVCGDFDGDGWTDIFVANDSNMDHLWLNGKDGTFVDQALLRGCALDETGNAKAGMGVSAVDVDDNGALDLLVVNLQSETDSFFLNQGDYFTDATAVLGLAWGSDVFTRFGVGIHDFDNDGLLDLYEVSGGIVKSSSAAPHADPFAEPNLLFRGQLGVRFEEVLPSGGTSDLLVGTSRGAAFGDVDNDGGMDVLVVNRDAPAYLLHNIAARRGNWLAFLVLGPRGSPALGARVRFMVDGTEKTREIRTAYSYLAANTPRLHVGLGAAERVSAVVVQWTDGRSERFGDFAANQIVTLRQGEGRSASTSNSLSESSTRMIGPGISPKEDSAPPPGSQAVGEELRPTSP